MGLLMQSHDVTEKVCTQGHTIDFNVVSLSCDIEDKYHELVKARCASLPIHPPKELSFEHDLLMSEIKFLELIMSIESTFYIDVFDDDVEFNATYGGLLDLVKATIND
mgnify:CR=1 FL=1